ncbi:MAG: type IV pilus twitching motility protein PilT [Bacillus sp. (in: Bacteria)]|nr:type IV pilus twitching motility protein PilT [Bacillus sp. (in: firmicutes)]
MDYSLEQLLKEATYMEASDVHLTVGTPPVFRIHGSLVRTEKPPLTEEDTKTMIQEVLQEALYTQLEENGEVDFSHGIPGVARFRFNVFRQKGQYSLAIRIIPRVIPALEKLSMPKVLKDIAVQKQGLVLVTGPTGSGKSTTLAAMIKFINENFNRHIITLEDPIEYLHEHKESIIDQREVGSDTGSFASGLRAALRQDPDVILVGEMRDLDTISTAITAAETGHLVFGTLHTSSASATIDRMIDVFPPNQQQQIRIQLAATLHGVISQRLLTTAHNDGRKAATEILINNHAIANLIRSEKTHQIDSILQTSRSEGMHTLESSIMDMLNYGLISMEDAKPYLKERGR